MTKYIYNRPKLAQYQTDIIDCEKRFTITEASTKSGKTVSHIVWLHEQALEGKSGNEFWWVAPIFSQAEIAFERMQRFVENKDYFIANKSKLSLRLPNGAIMRFKSADNPNSLYGEDVVAAVFDEFTRAKYNAWVALRSTLTATRGKCKFIGNYMGDFNWGHILSEKAKKSDSEYKYFKITAFQAAEAGILDFAEIEQAREDLSSEQFTMLYLAEGVDSGKMLFNPDSIKCIFENTHVSRNGKKYITADIAHEGSDAFVICVWHDWEIVKIYTMNKSQSKEVNDKIIKVKNIHGVPNTNIIYDADGVGSGVGGYIVGSIPFHNGGSVIPTLERKLINGVWVQEKENFAKLKHQCYWKFAEKVNKNEVSISKDCLDYEIQIKEELGAICKDMDSINKLGVLRIESKVVLKEKLGRSPDFADAMMLRVYFDLTQKRGFSMS